jgi:hypothetical protein
VLVGDVADANPERDLWVASDDAPGGVKGAMDVAEGPEDLEICEFGNVEISL